MGRNIIVCRDRGNLAGEQFEALTREISVLRAQLQAEENEGERQAQQKSLDELRAVHDAFKQDVQDAVAVTTAKDQIYALNQSLAAVKTLQEGLRGSLVRVRFTQVSS
jgi:predicted RNase H-like nuclease (RuvC/YqgF family)